MTNTKILSTRSLILVHCSRAKISILKQCHFNVASKMREKSLGPEHPNNLTSINKLGELLMSHRK